MAEDDGQGDACGWQELPRTDVTADVRCVPLLPAAPAEIGAAGTGAAGAAHAADIARADCLELGFGGFVLRGGVAHLIPEPREELLQHKRSSAVWDRGSALYIAPPSAVPPGANDPAAGFRLALAPRGDGVAEPVGERRGAPDALATRSGYFAALFRHGWADGGLGGAAAAGGEGHNFADFPGGATAFALAAAWLVARVGEPIGAPWPVASGVAACDAVAGAAYLDAPDLLAAAVRSWKVASAGARRDEDVLRVTEAVVRASLQFDGDAARATADEIRRLLDGLGRTGIELRPAFLVAPSAGLAVLEARRAVRQSIAENIRMVGGWIGSVFVGSQTDEGDEDDDSRPARSSSEFAVRLLERHEAHFLGRPGELRRLLSAVDVTIPIPPPLCFRVVSAALLASSAPATPGDASDEAVLAAAGPAEWTAMAVSVFERGLSSARSPAEAAADPSCIGALFGVGAGSNGAAGTPGLPANSDRPPLLDLDTLAREAVPPAAAAVVLSHVLSSWGASGSAGAANTVVEDAAAAVILDGVVDNRQRLRDMLHAVARRAEQGATAPRGTITPAWGSPGDLAVPELSAALAHGVAPHCAGGEAKLDAVRLLFRVLFVPTGGLPGVAYPLELLSVVSEQGQACAALAAGRALARLRELHDEGDAAAAWAAAERAAWPAVRWDDAGAAAVEDAVAMIRGWLLDARAAPTGKPGARQLAKACSVRLLLALPLQRLQDPEESLSPPVPAHVIAALALRQARGLETRVSSLASDVSDLDRAVTRLRSEVRTSS